MSVDIVDQFQSLNADDRRAVEVVATSMLAVESIGAPNGRQAWILRKAMEAVAEMKRSTTQQEAKP